MKASQMKPGYTYRYGATDHPGDRPGTVRVYKIEREDGMLYVTGLWRHEPASEFDGQGSGVFAPGDDVTEVAR